NGDHRAGRGAARRRACRDAGDARWTDLVASAFHGRRAARDRGGAPGGEQPPRWRAARDPRVRAVISRRGLSRRAVGARRCVLPGRLPPFKKLNVRGETTLMAMFWEFFSFELKFRAKSISTYIYFLLWCAFSFFCVASESFGPVGNSNGKVLLNGPYANSFNDFSASLFGVIVIAAIFGTSSLRDFQRDTYQMIFTKPISKGAYLGGRWAGSFVTTVFAFSGMMIGTWLGTFAPWADHARIAPNHIWWYVQPFLSIIVIQIFFLGSLFFAVAALTRKIFVVYLQGVALFMIYIVGLT